ncbi:hypothetical protein [Aporhodopirellula aestuarii]|uniref:Uncharacterized protein n=1 Tax=Aporhodopirellula aestuarii TaxID=2950107 RepID=A0ABT0U956_9BACT|nr:hypothetical protein [Aporhodopirellula aestuarii]MCM2373224.1 hypothetical protein [Aporhodopirellula aestuarii]
MRVLKAILFAVIAFPIGIVALLVVIATIGTDANSDEPHTAAARTISHSGPDDEDAVGLSRYQTDAVTLFADPSLSSQKAEAILAVLGSKCLFGSSDTDHLFTLETSNLANKQPLHELKLHSPLPLNVCHQLTPIYGYMASILSHECFNGEPTQFCLLNSENDTPVIAASRSDVATCWFDGNQSIFFDTELADDELNTALLGLRSLGMLPNSADFGLLFIRQNDEGGRVEVVSNEAIVLQIDPDVLTATLRDRATNLSLTLFGGRTTQFSLIGSDLQDIRCFTHQPPFQPTALAKNGCMLYLADESVSEETLDAIATRLPTIPGRDITIDMWIQQTGEHVQVLVPTSQKSREQHLALQRSFAATGAGIKAELTPEVDLEMVLCDHQFTPLHSFPINTRANACIACDNNRLLYDASFDKAFARAAADYFQEISLFNPDGAMHLELLRDEDSDVACVQMRVIASMLTTENEQQMQELGLQIVANLFPGQSGIFQLADALGTPIDRCTWLYPTDVAE